VKISNQPMISVVVPTDRTEPFVLTQDRFIIDFVAKRRDDNTYPKFCGLLGANSTTCNNCSTSADLLDYHAPVRGGNTLIVDFLACAQGVGEYAKYQPIKYYWYYDYGNHPDQYMTCSGPSATYYYCGAYLEEYDVRLCVDFEYKG